MGQRSSQHAADSAQPDRPRQRSRSVSDAPALAEALAAAAEGAAARPSLSIVTQPVPVEPPAHAAPMTHPQRLECNSAGAATSSDAQSSGAASSLPASAMASGGRMMLRSYSSAGGVAHAPLSASDLSSVSNAIREHLSLGALLPSTPATPSLLTQDAREQKLILLRSLFQAIDHDSNGYLEREELLDWCNAEPWLKQDHLQRETQRLLSVVTHDEDSRCSRQEFLAAFADFTTPDIITLIVNLLRAGMVAKVPRVTFVYNRNDFYLNGEQSNVCGGESNAGADGFPEISPEPGAHGALSVHDSTASSLVCSPTAQQRAEATKHFFLLEVLYEAMDRDLDGQLDEKDMRRWLVADPFVHEPENAELLDAVDRCWRELREKNAEAGFQSSDEHVPAGEGAGLARNANASASASSSTGTSAVGPARIDRHFFLLQLSQVPKKLIRKLLVHLLSRNASAVMESAADERQMKMEEQRKAASAVAAATAAAGGMVSPLATPLASPAASPSRMPAFPAMARRRSVVLGGTRRATGVPDGLRVILVGQSMLQHDIRAFPSGRACIEELRPLLQADVLFTELETSLLRDGQDLVKAAAAAENGGGARPRSSVFFHAASPVVLDVLCEMGFNLFSAANNHVGDLGVDGVRTLMEEFAARRLVMGGVGEDARQAALPVFFDSPKGRVGLVSFASKVPPHSVACDDPPRPGVNSLSMSDVDACVLNAAEEARILEAIKLAAEGFVHPVSGALEAPADLVLAYQHNHYWERNQTVNTEGKMGRWKRLLAHRLIDAGAHVYVAHGDPRLQGIEIYRGCPIFYCTGNFVFQTKTEVAFYGAEVWQSVLVHLHCHDTNDRERASYSVKLTPIQLNEEGATPATHLQTRGLPSVASRATGIAILHRLAMLSSEFGTRILVEDSVEGDPTSPVIGWVHAEPEAGKGDAVAAAGMLLTTPNSEQRRLMSVEHGAAHGTALRHVEADARARAAAAYAALSADERAASSGHFFSVHKDEAPLSPEPLQLPPAMSLLPPAALPVASQ